MCEKYKCFYSRQRTCKVLAESFVDSVDYYIKVVLELPIRPRGACQTTFVVRLS